MRYFTIVFFKQLILVPFDMPGKDFESGVYSIYQSKNHLLPSWNLFFPLPLFTDLYSSRTLFAFSLLLCLLFNLSTSILPSSLFRPFSFTLYPFIFPPFIFLKTIDNVWYPWRGVHMYFQHLHNSFKLCQIFASYLWHNAVNFIGTSIKGLWITLTTQELEIHVWKTS